MLQRKFGLSVVVPRKAQIGCGHALSFHSVVLENYFEIGPCVHIVGHISGFHRIPMLTPTCVPKKVGGG